MANRCFGRDSPAVSIANRRLVCPLGRQIGVNICEDKLLTDPNYNGACGATVARCKLSSMFFGRPLLICIATPDRKVADSNSVGLNFFFRLFSVLFLALLEMRKASLLALPSILSPSLCSVLTTIFEVLCLMIMSIQHSVQETPNCLHIPRSGVQSPALWLKPTKAIPDSRGSVIGEERGSVSQY